jgi:acyl-CoA thioesterase FadM
MDLGKARYFTDVTDQRVELGGLSCAIVNINCNFFSPAYFGEELQLVTRVSAVSVHSFKMEQRVYNPATGDVKCISTSVLAGFDPKTATGLPLPERLIAQLEDYEQRPLRVSK